MFSNVSSKYSCWEHRVHLWRERLLIPICGWGSGHHLREGCRSLTAGSSLPHPNQSKCAGRKVITRMGTCPWLEGWAHAVQERDSRYLRRLWKAPRHLNILMWFCWLLHFPEEDGAVQRDPDRACVELGNSSQGSDTCRWADRVANTCFGQEGVNES